MAIKPSLPNGGKAKYEGALEGTSQKFDNPRETHTSDIGDMASLHNDIGEKSGFQTTGYLVKKGTAYGEAAKFNFLPPGMDISNQETVDIRNMPLRKVVDISYPGDGWEPAPRDISEVAPVNNK